MAAKILTIITLVSSALAQMSGMENMSSMSGMPDTPSHLSEMASMSHASGSSTELSGSYTTATASTWANSVPTGPSTSSSAMTNGTWATTGMPMGTGGATPNATSGGQIPVPGAGAENSIPVGLFTVSIAFAASMLL